MTFEKVMDRLMQETIIISFIRNRDSPGILRIEVKDEGIGIGENDLDSISHVAHQYEAIWQKRKDMQHAPLFLRPTALFGIGLQSIYNVCKEFMIHSENGEQAIDIFFRPLNIGGYIDYVKKDNSSRDSLHHFTCVKIDITPEVVAQDAEYYGDAFEEECLGASTLNTQNIVPLMAKYIQSSFPTLPLIIKIESDLGYHDYYSNPDWVGNSAIQSYLMGDKKTYEKSELTYVWTDNHDCIILENNKNHCFLVRIALNIVSDNEGTISNNGQNKKIVQDINYRRDRRAAISYMGCAVPNALVYDYPGVVSSIEILGIAEDEQLPLSLSRDDISLKLQHEAEAFLEQAIILFINTCEQYCSIPKQMKDIYDLRYKNQDPKTIGDWYLPIKQFAFEKYAVCGILQGENGTLLLNMCRPTEDELPVIEIQDESTRKIYYDYIYRRIDGLKLDAHLYIPSWDKDLILTDMMIESTRLFPFRYRGFLVPITKRHIIMIRKNRETIAKELLKKIKECDSAMLNLYELYNLEGAIKFEEFAMQIIEKTLEGV